MRVDDLNDIQRYLVEEEAEKWQDRLITRRELVRRITLLVGGAAAASGVPLSLGCDLTSNEGAGVTDDGPRATAPPRATATQDSSERNPNARVPEDDPGIAAEMVELPAADPSLKLIGYLARRKGSAVEKLGAVLVIHENRGLTDYIKDVVRRTAKAGYVALCVDLISRQGGTAAHPDEAERTGILGQLSTDDLLSDLSAGLDYLKARDDVDPDKLGVVGFCFGGGMTWRLITRREDVKAAVPFYGPNPPLEDVPKIKAAVMGVYAANDERITGKVPELEKALDDADVTHAIKVYPGVDQAFHNDTGQRYDARSADDAWTKTLGWFGRYMK